MTGAPGSGASDADLLAGLRRAGVADVDGSGLARALYSSDASLYRDEVEALGLGPVTVVPN